MAHAQVDDEVHADERQVALVELNVRFLDSLDQGETPPSGVQSVAGVRTYVLDAAMAEPLLP